jgi:hypothetical protein
VIAIRISVLSKLSCIVAASCMLTLGAMPADAQQYRGTRNSTIGTIGDLPNGLIRPRVKPNYNLRFGPRGLFRGSELFGQFSAPRQFVFGLPDFSGAGHDFTDVSFDDYLTFVANSYQVADSADYLLRFQFLNEVTAQAPDFIPTFSQVVQAHQQDFIAGGGFLPFGAPTIPTIPEPEPEPFEPFDPVFPGPFDVVDNGDSDSDTSSASQLAAEIVPVGGDLGGDADTGVIVPTSASQSQAQAANVSAVPEPATLGLLALGATALLGRSRRR